MKVLCSRALTLVSLKLVMVMSGMMGGGVGLGGVVGVVVHVHCGGGVG